MMDRVERPLRQPFAKFLMRFLSRKNFIPDDLPLSLIGFGDRRVEHALGRPPDIRAGAVAFDEGNDRVVRNLRFPVFDADRFAFCGGSYSVKYRHKSSNLLSI